MKKVDFPTVKPALKKAILDAVALKYTSVSCKDGIETGNHYQSLTLGDEQTAGFRTGREGFLDQIDFRGKRVLDLGSNLGEISRAVRTRGAAVVDGYEYDPFFVELAQAINAYNGTSGVSFYERDITDPDTYRERYDIVLALSVFTYINPVLRRLAEMTDLALVIETHKLDGNLERDYLGPVSKLLPAYAVLGESEWGRSFSQDEKRAVIVFARDKPTLARVLGSPSGSRKRLARVSVQKTRLQRLFFDEVPFSNADDLLTSVREMEINLAQVADDPDLAKSVYSGKTYWLLFLKGFCQYLATRTVGAGNVYFEYITNYYAPRRHDPGISDALSDPLFAIERIAARFRDAERFRQNPQTYLPAPIRIFRSGDPRIDRLEVCDADTGEIVHASAVDGWHRLFAARLFGAVTLPAEVVETKAT